MPPFYTKAKSYFSDNKNFRIFTAIVSLVIVLEVLDITTTIIGMGLGATETNMFISNIMTSYGYTGLVFSKILAMSISIPLLYYLSKIYTPKRLKVFGIFIILMLSMVIVNNTVSLVNHGAI